MCPAVIEEFWPSTASTTCSATVAHLSRLLGALDCCICTAAVARALARGCTDKTAGCHWTAVSCLDGGHRLLSGGASYWTLVSCD